MSKARHTAPIGEANGLWCEASCITLTTEARTTERTMTELTELLRLDDLSSTGLAARGLLDNEVLVALGESTVRVSSTARQVMRVIDVVVASVSLIVLSPLVLAASVLIAMTSRGPVIFRQQRVGRDGRLFEVLKFRTMVDGTHLEVLADPVTRDVYERNDFKLPQDDPRITKVGRFLRKTSLDEVPQLVNVIRGEMGLVGVRPLLERELKLRPEHDRQLYYLQRPGLTGLWQIAGRSMVGDLDRFALDREYLQTWSVRTNVRILLRTPRAVLRGAGAH